MRNGCTSGRETSPDGPTLDGDDVDGPWSVAAVAIALEPFQVSRRVLRATTNFLTNSSFEIVSGHVASAKRTIAIL